MHYQFGGLIFGGAYTWRSLFSEFYGSLYSNNTVANCNRTNYRVPLQWTTTNLDMFQWTFQGNLKCILRCWHSDGNSFTKEVWFGNVWSSSWGTFLFRWMFLNIADVKVFLWQLPYLPSFIVLRCNLIISLISYSKNITIYWFIRMMYRILTIQFFLVDVTQCTKIISVL